MTSKVISLVPIHPGRRQQIAAIARMNPVAEFEAIYRRTVTLEFPAEIQTGFQIAFYRPEAVPRMAAVLSGTGHIQANPMTRTYDTGLVILEVIVGGLDSDRGAKMTQLLRRLHDRPDIHQEDMTYVLNSLMVVPIRYIERAGWRDLLDVERDAAWRFWCALGNRIGVANLPSSYAAAVQQFDDYENTQLGVSAEGRRLTQLILNSFAEWLPRLLRPHVSAITSTLIDDARFSAALGLPPPRRALRALFKVAITIRQVQQRLSPPRLKSRFTPGQPVEGVYPDGYDLDDLGPPKGQRAG